LKERVFEEPEQTEPRFPGGVEGFKKFIQSNLKSIPGATGKRLIVTFVVEKDGSLSGITIARGINKEADEEALRVVKLSPRWKPGTQNNIVVRVAYVIPIVFN
jgi:TonB family protein